LVRIQFCEGPVERVRNRIEIGVGAEGDESDALG
jgi:hypothetical protein